jgi:hypothetical protein
VKRTLQVNDISMDARSGGYRVVGEGSVYLGFLGSSRTEAARCHGRPVARAPKEKCRAAETE